MTTVLLISDHAYPYSGIEEFLYESLSLYHNSIIYWLSFDSNILSISIGYKYKKIQSPFYLFTYILEIVNPTLIHCVSYDKESIYSKINKNIKIIWGYHVKITNDLILNGYTVNDDDSKKYGLQLIQPFPLLYPLLSVNKKYILIINPCKSLDIYTNIINSCPNLPFLVISHINISVDHSNIKIISWKKNMRKIYTKIKILLLFSDYDESFSRIAYESLFYEIPTITNGSGHIKKILGSSAVYCSNIQESIDQLFILYHNRDKYDQICMRLYKRKKRFQGKYEEMRNRLISLIK